MLTRYEFEAYFLTSNNCSYYLQKYRNYLRPFDDVLRTVDYFDGMVLVEMKAREFVDPNNILESESEKTISVHLLDRDTFDINYNYTWREGVINSVSPSAVARS